MHVSSRNGSVQVQENTELSGPNVFQVEVHFHYDAHMFEMVRRSMQRIITWADQTK